MREEHVTRSFIHGLHFDSRFKVHPILPLSFNARELGYLADGTATLLQPRDDSLSWARSVEHNARLVVLNVPDDIWIYIFEQHVVESAKTMADLEKLVLVLSSVCRTLRHVCINTSRLWGLFSIDNSRYSSLFFERCGTAPLRILLDTRHGSTDAQSENWNNLKKHLYHTKSLVLTFSPNKGDPSSFFQVGELLRQSAPLLCKLRLIARGTTTRKVIPAGSFGQDWQRLRVLDLQNLRLDDAGSYPALSNITALQYTNFGQVSSAHLTWLFRLLPRIERLGLAAPDHNVQSEDFGSDYSPVDVPSSLLRLVLDGMSTEEVKIVLPLFSRAPRLEARPTSDHEHPSLFAEPWNLLKRVNIRWRRAVVEYHTADAVDAEPRVLKFYARRRQITNSLSGASARFLTTLLLDESAWDFLVFQGAWTKDRPVVLPTLVTLRITLANCIYSATKIGRVTTTIGVFAQPGFLEVFDMPCLNNLDLVHDSFWTCARVLASEATEKHSPHPCFCHNNGVVALIQVVDLLHHLRGVVERRLPQLRIFGVKEILDEHPELNANALNQMVTSVEFHVQVPEGYEYEDAEINEFDGLVVRPKPDEDDPRYTFQ